eukprot:SAG31_NODE_8210_length_1496_cov_1.258411_2_plen_137_part_00
MAQLSSPGGSLVCALIADECWLARGAPVGRIFFFVRQHFSDDTLILLQTINPTFCKFNQAQISDCTYDLLMGSGAASSAASTLTNGSAVTMHFDGAALLKASLAKLATLGLKSAKRVLLNGVGWGGAPLRTVPGGL